MGSCVAGIRTSIPVSDSWTRTSPLNHKPHTMYTQTIQANHAHARHVSQLKKTANTTANNVINLNEKGGAKAPSNNTSNDSPQEASSVAIADTSHVRYAAAKSHEKNIRAAIDRKRKSSSDDEPLPKKGVRKKYRYECSANECTNLAVQGGVCKKHGAKKKVQQCSSEGCTNIVVRGGVCIKHGAIVTRKQCSSEGCSNLVVRGGVCIRHGAKSKQCSSEGCSNKARRAGGVCSRHGAKEVDRHYCEFSADGCKNVVVSWSVPKAWRREESY